MKFFITALDTSGIGDIAPRFCARRDEEGN